MRVYDRDLIRGGHYGQRSCEPHLQAEHMAAPTNAAKREESSCQLGAVHTWHETDMARCPGRVRFRGQSGSWTSGLSGQLLTHNGRPVLALSFRPTLHRRSAATPIRSSVTTSRFVGERKYGT